MTKLTIDNIEVEVPEGYTIFQACKVLEKEVPHFCYHERLSVAGNCRMCLVQVENAPKPVASCAMPVAEGMVVSTKSEMVQKARKGVMEFLLINHPLDCPICDQGGECDLQDQAMSYGFDRTRFEENKRSVKNKNFGPLVKTIMTRCIHCTRCVRFITEVAGVADIGGLYRGEKMEIGNYVEKAVGSELSGNIIDLCPVGALTSKPYQFKARSWELKKTETIDVTDAVGSNIRVDSRGPEVMRVLPRLNEDVNEEWISDKARFSYDGLLSQRLDRPYIRKDGKLTASNWEEALAVVAEKMDKTMPEQMAGIVGDMADCESMVALKDLLEKFGSKNIDTEQNLGFLAKEKRSNYLFNSTISGIEEADCCLLIGADPKWEAPILNARMRKRWLVDEFPVAAIGPEKDFTYDVNWLGDKIIALQDIFDGKNDFAKILEKADKPMLILGSSLFERDDAQDIVNLAKALANKYGFVKEGWNGFNLLHKNASQVGALDLGIGQDTSSKEILEKAQAGKIKFVYLLGADNIDFSKLNKSFVVYQGHHGDQGAHHADVILPGATYTEKNGTYVNTEGRVQQANIAVFPPGDAKEDWKIIRALSEKVGKTLPYDIFDQVQTRLIEINDVFKDHNTIHDNDWEPGHLNNKIELGDEAIAYAFDNFYMTNVISKASKTMAACLKTFCAKTQAEEEKQVVNG